MYDSEDFENVCNVFDKEIFTLEKDEALIFMGHGTDHFANSAYFRMLYSLNQKSENVFMSLVEDEPSFEDVVEIIKDKDITRARLLPFMIVAGDHAINDMASDEDDSLKSMLEEIGVKCISVLEGLGSKEEIVNIFLDKVSEMIQE